MSDPTPTTAGTTRAAEPGSARTPGQHPEQFSYLSHKQILVVLFGVMSGMLLAALDQSIVGTALPRIVGDLGGLNQYSWVVTAYLLTSTAVTPLWGKVSDLYGRRLIFQISITIFLIGSALSGASQNMIELIGFRALQGIGGGGLFSIALAIIGDVIPPRERGRYQGYFGAVFGVSSVAGPLLGGWLTDGPGWRWIFYINLPIGIAALFVTSMALKMPVVRRNHAIDYAGAAAIMTSVTSLLLYLNWSGGSYGWFAPLSLALLTGFLVLAAVFVWVESRASEPIIPLRLFQIRTYSVGNVYGFLSGFAMFGAMIFLPLYLQAVKGMSPTISGLAMVPTVIGLFSASIGSGQLMTRTGHYRIFPILGALIMTGSLVLMSQISATIAYWHLAGEMFMFGFGLGLTMQTIVTAVQNAVTMRDMGTATSSTTFFRQLGAAIGTAVFGAVLSARLTHYLAAAFAGGPALPSTGAGAGANLADSVQRIQALPAPVKAKVVGAFSSAIGDVFLVGVPFLVIAFVVALLLKEVPLRTAQSHGARGPGDEELVEPTGLI